ncbi:MAG: hypothetical protein R6U56_08225 [Opitutales bacterium]
MKKDLIGAERVACSSVLSPGSTGTCSLDTASWQKADLKISQNNF